MKLIRAVMDTNVLLSGLRSNKGASSELLQLLRAGKWNLVLSNTVVAEYEEILKREAVNLSLSPKEIDKFLDALCLLADRHRLSIRWMPLLSDPNDEAFVHLASEADVEYLVTHNVKHLKPARQLGIKVVAPREFLSILRLSS